MGLAGSNLAMLGLGRLLAEYLNLTMCLVDVLDVRLLFGQASLCSTAM